MDLTFCIVGGEMLEGDFSNIGTVAEARRRVAKKVGTEPMQISLFTASGILRDTHELPETECIQVCKREDIRIPLACLQNLTDEMETTNDSEAPKQLLVKTSENAWDAVAVSEGCIEDGDARLTFLPASTPSSALCHVGLVTDPNPDTHWRTIDYAICCDGCNQLRVRELGEQIAKTDSRYEVGDILQIAIVNGVVKYSQNGSVIHESKIKPLYPLYVRLVSFSKGRVAHELMGLL